ncbi:MAG: GHKL domain-containing protein, partial [Alphaproteobacteria bacterium]|nr:GHKL domain-containing protein [Alphaproteobacteria bacterium]
AWTLIALPVVGAVIYSLIGNLIMDGFDTRLRQHTWLLQAEAINGDTEPGRPRDLGEPLFGVTNSGWYWRIKPHNDAPGRRYVSDSLATGTLPSPHEQNAERTEGDMRWMDVTGPLGQPLRVVELIGTLSERADAPVYLFAVAGPLDWPQSTINNFGMVLILAFALLGLALLTATVLQVKWALRPLVVIEQGLSKIRTGEAERLDGEFPSEIEPLQVELNALIESNEDIIERARTQVGNLAHALKTPLAVLTNEADQDHSPLAQKVSEQAGIMGTQISHYLDRARMAARANSIGRMTPILPVAEGLRRALERIYFDKNVKITIECDGKLAFRGEKQDLEELLGNLLDNAAKWAEAKVRLHACSTSATRHTGQWLLVTIEDDGPGVPATARDQMMKRGRRLDESKPGSGLGLSIVQDLVTSYRGDLQLSKSQMGGLKAELRLPAVG